MADAGKPVQLTLSQIALPTFLVGLTQLSVILDKAQAYAAEKNIEPARVLEHRLAPDMYTLRRQVQLAADFAQVAVARLAGLDEPTFEKRDMTIDELQRHIATARDFIGAVDPARLNAAVDRRIEFIARGEPRHFDTGLAYLLHSAIPNVHFHLAIAYGLCRNFGCPLGKSDFLG